VARVHEIVPREIWEARYDQINDFERELTQNSVVILKFFLHVSRKEQKKRLQERLDNPKKNWKFRLGDLDDRKKWDDYTAAYHDAIAKCSTKWAPWYIVPANDEAARNYLVANKIADTLEGLGLKYPKLEKGMKDIEIE
ncbi:MAG TPA: polyphosphate kinase 2 family protein, partial [Gemmatimonadaceae bacterium]|nr:polyphosphate kinase 2 family protein [Gemmatimonadaceae bacterium]